MASLRSAAIGELIGTTFLVTVAISSAILPLSMLDASISVTVFINAVAVTLVLVALVETFGPLSGAHFNPAVTLGFLLSGEITRRKAAWYVSAQLLGGFMGVIISHLMFFDTIPILLTLSENSMSSGQYFAEVVGTFILIGVIFGCLRGGSKHVGLSIGFIVGGMIVATSSTMFANPAVTVARMFTYAISGITIGSGLIFIVAEVLGAILATGVFVYLLYPKTDDVPNLVKSVTRNPDEEAGD